MNSSSNTLIPERLKSAREQLNLSKAEAARRIGLTAASYVRYEAGDRSPSSQVLQSIAEGLQTSVAFLSGETEESKPDRITVFKQDNPLLFDLISAERLADDATLQRLLSYYRRLTNPD